MMAFETLVQPAHGRHARPVTTSFAPPRRGLGRAGGVAAGFASVVGAGLLGLPSAVLHETGDAAVLVWLVAAALCVPMVVLFHSTIEQAPGSGDPLRDTVRAGLGDRWGDVVPLMFGLAVVVGLPANAMVAAHNLVAATGLGLPAGIIAAAVLTVAVLTNVTGRNASARLQQVGAVVLVAALVLFVVWALADPRRRPQVAPAVSSLPSVPAGVLLAFWAFVGFENLTFLARDLARPHRDFRPVALITLALLAVLAIALTLAIAAHLPASSVDPVTGLVDAARTLPAGVLAATGVALAGTAGILLNAVAWLRGVGLILASAAREGLLPSAMAGRDPAGPRRAILVLAVGVTVTVVFLSMVPAAVVPALAAASAVFVVIYLICIVAFVRINGPGWWTAAAGALIPLMLLTLVRSGWRASYAAAAFVAALLIRRAAHRRARRHRSRG